VHDNCVGVYVDPGIGATVRDNRIVGNNAPCPHFVSGIGVWLDAANGTTVTGNLVSGHTPAGFGAAVIVATILTLGPLRGRTATPLEHTS